MSIFVKLFVVKSRHKFSCASTVYFNSNQEIRENCEFDYYFNKTDLTPSVLDGGQQIILTNWQNYKRIICTHNSNIPVNIPSHIHKFFWTEIFYAIVTLKPKAIFY